MIRIILKKHISVAPAILFACSAVSAQDQVFNIYSARHDPTDQALYNTFTKTAGININRVDAVDAGILARLKAAEGTTSPADVILLVDAARLGKGEVD
jgi:iron(III) transport system substrate-binding protein